MATCCQPNSLMVAQKAGILALSEGVVRKKLGKRRLSERVMEVAVKAI